MVFLSGSRQTGKLTIGRAMLSHESNEFTLDDKDLRKAWVWSPAGSIAARQDGPILLDEIHKVLRWKLNLRGIFDMLRSRLPIIVAGSARLDASRKGGDSLLGRYFPYHVHPFSVGETSTPPFPDENFSSTTSIFPLNEMFELGTLPEPLLGGSEERDLRNVQNLHQIQILAQFAPNQSFISFFNSSQKADSKSATLTLE
jgi:hypothetical protein